MPEKTARCRLSASRPKGIASYEHSVDLKRIPAELLKKVGLQPLDYVDISIVKGGIKITKAEQNVIEPAPTQKERKTATKSGIERLAKESIRQDQNRVDRMRRTEPIEPQ